MGRVVLGWGLDGDFEVPEGIGGEEVAVACRNDIGVTPFEGEAV